MTADAEVDVLGHVWRAWRASSHGTGGPLEGVAIQGAGLEDHPEGTALRVGILDPASAEREVQVLRVWLTSAIPPEEAATDTLRELRAKAQVHNPHVRTGADWSSQAGVAEQEITVLREVWRSWRAEPRDDELADVVVDAVTLLEDLRGSSVRVVWSDPREAGQPRHVADWNFTCGPDLVPEEVAGDAVYRVWAASHGTY